MMRLLYLVGACADFLGSNPCFVLIVQDERVAERGLPFKPKRESRLRGWVMPETEMCQ
jgi:hypothetical protein